VTSGLLESFEYVKKQFRKLAWHPLRTLFCEDSTEDGSISTDLAENRINSKFKYIMLRRFAPCLFSRPQVLGSQLQIV
jgi:hypothetical protein